VLVVGTGGAGTAAAIRAAELGRRVGIVEHGTVGGTCVNVGCIPSKNLLSLAARRHTARAGFAGLGGCEPSLDWPEALRHKRELIDGMRRSKYLDVLESYPAITLLRGSARFAAGAALEIDGVPQAAPRVILATGTAPWVPPIPGIDGVDLLDSASAMEVPELPRSLIVLGGGTVGLELGQAFSRLGVHVTVLERLPRLLPGEHEAAASELRRQLEAEGIEIVTGANVSRVETGDRRVLVTV